MYLFHYAQLAVGVGESCAVMQRERESTLISREKADYKVLDKQFIELDHLLLN